MNRATSPMQSLMHAMALIQDTPISKTLKDSLPFTPAANKDFKMSSLIDGVQNANANANAYYRRENTFQEHQHSQYAPSQTGLCVGGHIAMSVSSADYFDRSSVTQSYLPSVFTAATTLFESQGRGHLWNAITGSLGWVR